ncbi:hypothetical protein I7I48_07853 [Histoplasma ohiense]|nr:hypothetical protein I7I48_07853 [Histoplasma ohiense (nom. inval.)]
MKGICFPPLFCDFSTKPHLGEYESETNLADCCPPLTSGSESPVSPDHLFPHHPFKIPWLCMQCLTSKTAREAPVA